METVDNPLVLHRLGELEKKVDKIETNTTQMAIDFAVAKTELLGATGKTSTLISSVISVIVGLLVAIVTSSLGR